MANSTLYNVVCTLRIKLSNNNPQDTFTYIIYISTPCIIHQTIQLELTPILIALNVDVQGLA